MIDVMIITFNESLNLPHCLRALQGWTKRIFVIDSGSTDGTPDLAREMGAEVVHHDWEGYARQKNWGLKNLPFESDWILIVDADEVITPEIRDRLVSIARQPLDQVKENGFAINRLTYFLNRPIRHCGYFPSWNLRFFKRGMGVYEDREVHEHVIIDDPIGYIHEPMIHNDRRGLEHYAAKHNRYSTLEARSLFEERMAISRGEQAQANLSRDTRQRRWLKRNVLPHAPMPWLWRFFYMYVLRRGVLDGMVGLEFCRFISMYDYLVAMKYRALVREMKASGDESAVSRRVSALAVPEGDAPPINEARREDGRRRGGTLSGDAAHTNGRSAAGQAAATAVMDREPKEPVPAVDGSAARLNEHEESFDPYNPHQMRPEASPWSFKEKVGRAIWMLIGKPLFRCSFHNWYGYRARLLRLFGAKVGRGVALRPTVNIEVPWMLDLDDDCTVGDHAILYSLGQIRIGKRSIISQYAHLCAGTHDYADHTFKLIRSPVTIGNDVWVGADAFVGPGVEVGDLSVLGARSSAYKSVGKQCVYVGNPARNLKERVLQ